MIKSLLTPRLPPSSTSAVGTSRSDSLFVVTSFSGKTHYTLILSQCCFDVRAHADLAFRYSSGKKLRQTTVYPTSALFINDAEVSLVQLTIQEQPIKASREPSSNQPPTALTKSTPTSNQPPTALVKSPPPLSETVPLTPLGNACL